MLSGIFSLPFCFADFKWDTSKQKLTRSPNYFIASKFLFNFLFIYTQDQTEENTDWCREYAILYPHLQLTIPLISVKVNVAKDSLYYVNRGTLVINAVS